MGGAPGVPPATSAAAPSVAQAGYALESGASACANALADPTHPESVPATFGLVQAPSDCAPPVFTVGLVTTDGGCTWRFIPQPPGGVKPFLDS